MPYRSAAALLLPLLAVSLHASAQQPPARELTREDYANAERFMPYNVAPLVSHTFAEPTFLPDNRFWYRDTSPEGTTFQLVDPAKGTLGPAFDQTKLASAITAAIAKLPLPNGMARARTLDPHHLPITAFTPEPGNDRILTVDLGGIVQMRCDLAGLGACSPVAPVAAGQPAEPRAGQSSTQVGGNGQMAARPNAGRARAASELSPDKRKQAFLRDWNLWIRDTASGAETQLTTDGVKDFGYATDNAGWTHSDNPILVWSPDSSHIATFQQDQRKTGEMYIVSTTQGHPQLETLKYPLPGDVDVTMIQRVVLDINTRQVVRFKMPPDQHRSSLCDDISCRGGAGWDDVLWAPDSRSIAFVSTSRDHKQEWLRIADSTTGAVRDIYTETVPKFFESGNGRVNWKYFPKTNEFLWFSERDNWGQMYLYDLQTGKLKNQITTGEGNVTQVLHVDETNRVLYFLAVGKEKGRDPYFSAFYRVDFDGKNQKLLTPEDADHAITPSPDPEARYFVDVFSTPTEPQTAVVRDNTGKLLVELGKQDITKLLAAGWVPPTPITVKARDGKTDLYGYLFKPTTIDMGRKYPIINHIYPGPQTGSCGSRAFSAAHSDLQALAQLGFVVVCIDGMGTPWRSKAFHEAYFGDMGDNTIPDQVAGMKDLAARYPYIDLAHAGIYGHSGGGYAAAAAMFHYPDFFSVGISESGNHDNRIYEDDWAEKWTGLLETKPDGTTNYDSQATQATAANLKGHLLLAHGTFDDNVPPNNTLLVVDALIKANKDFDLLMIPNAAHGYGAASAYMTRRRWDYFVRYLGGAIPPAEYEMQASGRSKAGGGPGPDAEATPSITFGDLWQ